MFYKALLLPLLLISSVLCGQSVQKTMLRVPDTGETISYTTTPGEDADYTIYPPFFIKNGDGTITDTVTGLMWQQTDGGEMTIENAITYAENLNLAGYTDWRLPNALESYSILNHNKANPALDVNFFTNTGAEYWWTSEKQVNDASRVWVTNAGGGVGNHPKTETVSAGGTKKFHARAVRVLHAPVSLENRFTDAGDGTITDHLTNLVWQKVPNPDSVSWENALIYAENLDLAGKNDWRLPNIKEIESLNDFGLINPSVNTTFFPAIGLKKYWASTTLPNQTTRAWYLDTRFGITTYALKTQKLNLLCVRGKQEETVATQAAILADKIRVGPNPFYQFIQVDPSLQNARFELWNAAGQCWYAGRRLGTTDFADLPAGVYFLMIQQDETSPKQIFPMLKANY